MAGCVEEARIQDRKDRNKRRGRNQQSCRQKHGQDCCGTTSCSYGCLGPKVSAHFSSPPSLANDDSRLGLDFPARPYPWDELTPQPGEFTYPIGSSNRLIGLALDPAFAGRLVRKLGAIFDVELLQKLANVELDGVGAQVDLVGDV